MTNALAFAPLRRAVTLTVTVGILVSSSLVAAQTTPAVATTGPSEAALAARRTLVERAQSASHAGRHQEALTHADAAARIEMSPSLRMFIAQERAALGLHSAAMEAADQCVRETTRNLTVERRETILSQCRQIARDSQAHVVLVTVNGPAALANGVVLRVGSRTPELGVPLNVDPGSIEVEVTAPGVETFHEQRAGIAGAVLTFTIPDRFAQVLVITTTAVAHTSTSTTPLSSTNISHVTAHQHTGPGTIASPMPPRTPSTLRLLGPVVGGVGIALGVTAVGTFLLHEDVARQYNNLSVNDCSPDSTRCTSLVADAERYRGLTIALGITGSVLVAAGAVLLVTGIVRGDPPTSRPALVLPMIGRDHGGIGLHANF